MRQGALVGIMATPRPKQDHSVGAICAPPNRATSAKNGDFHDRPSDTAPEAQVPRQAIR